MKRQLIKGIVCVFFTFILTCPDAFGQWSKRGKNPPPSEDIPAFKITKNNLKDLGDLELVLVPLKWDAGYTTNLSFYLEGNYLLNDRLSIGAYTGISYLFDSGNVNIDFQSTDLIKNPLQLGLQGEYAFLSKKKKKEYKIVVESEHTGYKEITHYYVPVKGKQFIKMGARAGFNYQKALSATSFIQPESGGYADEGLVNTNFGYVHLGISRTKIDNIEVDIEGFGEKNEKASRYLYLDVLVNTNTSFDPAVPTPFNETDFIATEQFTTTPLGLRLGYKTMPFSKSNWYWGYELGLKPGPFSDAVGLLHSNGYLSISIGLGSMVSIK